MLHRTRILTALFILFTLVIICSCRSQKPAPYVYSVEASDCLMDTIIAYNLDSIIEWQKNESIELHPTKGNKLDILKEAKKNRLSLFPYQPVDSAVYVYSQVVAPDKNDYRWEHEKPQYTVILCKEKLDAFLNWTNDPANFGYAECGTQIAEAQVLLYSMGIRVAEVTFACEGRSVSFSPDNILANYGEINQTGYQRLEQIKPWK